MTLPIPPIPPSSLSGVGSVGGATAGASASPGFADAIQSGLETVSQMEFAADAAIQDVASGGDTSVHELMVATSKAQLGVELVAQVRDKAIEAYNEIMRMQV